MPESNTQQLFKEYATRFQELLEHLNNELLPRLVDTINTHVSPQHFGKLSLSAEPIPLNERNLTDTRTRIGVLLEYALAFELHKVLEGGTYSAGFLVANQFPDITTRHVTDFTQGARLEIKAIQTISEEKAANFSTLIQDISPNQDILCVLVWEWRIKLVGVADVHYPHILGAYAMHAHVIARLRDMVWLALEGKYKSPKLIDIAGALVPNSQNADEKVMKSEENNLGKLTRMISAHNLSNIDDKNFSTLKLDISVKIYYKMLKFAYNKGIEEIVERELEEAGIYVDVTWQQALELDNFALMTTIDLAGQMLHIVGNDTGRPLTLSAIDEMMKSMNVGDAMIEINPKFGWLLGKIEAREKNPKSKNILMVKKRITISQKKKPKELRKALIEYYSNASATSSATSD